MIVVAYATSSEHAMVIPFEDTGVTGVAVPRARRRQALANRAQPPSVRNLRRAHGYYVPPSAGIVHHRIREITHDIQHNKSAENEMEHIRQARILVQFRQHYPQSVPVH